MTSYTPAAYGPDLGDNGPRIAIHEDGNRIVAVVGPPHGNNQTDGKDWAARLAYARQLATAPDELTRLRTALAETREALGQIDRISRYTSRIGANLNQCGLVARAILAKIDGEKVS
jgi:hypothetical protein